MENTIKFIFILPVLMVVFVIGITILAIINIVKKIASLLSFTVIGMYWYLEALVKFAFKTVGAILTSIYHWAKEIVTMPSQAYRVFVTEEPLSTIFKNNKKPKTRTAKEAVEDLKKEIGLEEGSSQAHVIDLRDMKKSDRDKITKALKGLNTGKIKQKEFREKYADILQDILPQDVFLRMLSSEELVLKSENVKLNKK